ncbi:hypothetical protein TVAG_285350 [Trichomonas vaginalis G3]|uniref:Glycosyltransferase 61 catalytic domain-containing protein n=1 Tax=Trichomonas vaginalis (strain ATCC PRA-98 / G3) TaxID=412133 RepID=A2GG84_TRIV3|nr:glycosyltransferase family [Trichomonas vaginalis G3]EAX83834.1 hypothetical protein TVAG_285350 [Trichomonas vaginalis G3]KAI5539048.1 glycosyltransferase family [Trichomonas vaginalis G3]|eukprot:XP_001296764.1 hypothetical protein [Trichomonas vaginalis G3]
MAFLAFNKLMIIYPSAAFVFQPILGKIDIKKESNLLPKNKFISLFKIDQTFPDKRKDLVLFYGNKMRHFVPKIIPIKNSIYDQSNHFHGNFVHATKMYASSGYAITDGKTVYKAPDCNNDDYMVYNYPGDVVGQYENVLLVGHVGASCFAHFINEVMNPTLFFPEEIFKKSYLVVEGPPKMWKDITAVFGFEGRTIHLEHHQWIYCENLYTVVEPRPHGGYYGPALYHLHMLFRKSFNLSQIAPNKVGFLNRKGPYRVISNYQNLIETAKEKYSNEIFFFIPDALSAFNAAKTFASCKILMTATGSSCINVIYMADKTCLIKIIGPVVDMCNIIVPSSLDIFQINLYYSEMSMYQESITYLDISESMKALELAFYVIKHKKWPEINEYTYLI